MPVTGLSCKFVAPRPVQEKILGPAACQSTGASGKRTLLSRGLAPLPARSLCRDRTGRISRTGPRPAPTFRRIKAAGKQTHTKAPEVFRRLRPSAGLVPAGRRSLSLHRVHTARKQENRIGPCRAAAHRAVKPCRQCIFCIYGRFFRGFSLRRNLLSFLTSVKRRFSKLPAAKQTSHVLLRAAPGRQAA